jgi:hypothetical protein
MFRILLILIITLIQFTALSQISKVVDLFPYGSGYKVLSAQSGGFLYVFDKYSDPNGKMVKLKDGIVSELGSFGDLYDFIPVDNGVFFITTKGASRNISYVDTVGKVFESETVSNNGFGLTPIIFNQKLYIAGQTHAHKLFESDGTKNGTKVIYQSANPINIITVFDDKLIFANHNGNQSLMYWMNSNGHIQLFDSIQISNLKSFGHGIGINNDKFYFNVVLDDYSSSIQKMDTLGNGMELFIDDFNGDNIEFMNDSFVITQSTYPQIINAYSGNINRPIELQEIPFENEIRYGATTIVDKLPLDYYRFYAPNVGYEFGKLNNGKFSIIQDLAKGPASSGICLQSDAHYGLCDFNQQTREYNGNLYSILSNGNNSSYYLYQISNDEYTSIVKIPNVENLESFYIYADYLYLIRNEVDHSFLEKVFIGAVQETQPELDPNLETWFRQVDARVTDTYHYDFHNIKGDPAQIDEDGNVFLMVYTDKNYDSTNILVSNSDLIHNQEAANVLIKFNKHGQLMWVKSFGSTEGVYGPRAQFTLDNNGDVLISDVFVKLAVFGGFELKTGRVGYYLTKIDGETGAYVWAEQIMESNYTNINLDGIETDDYGNIYLSLMYPSFKVRISNISLESDRSPVNAVAKFDANGRIIWAKNIKTPWLDYYGNTRVFEYSEKAQSLTAVQTQGSYNVWSSCKFHEWSYFIQTIDLEGEVKDTFTLDGTDLGSISVGTVTNENRLFGMGYYRGDLETGSFNLSSSKECESEGFGFIYDNEIGDVLASFSTSDSVFYPFDIAKNVTFIYVLGTHGTNSGYEYGDLRILKFTHQGALVGYKDLNQRILSYDSNPRNYIDVKGDYIIVTGANFESNEEYGINPLMRNSRTISLLKLKNENWTPATSLFYKQKLPAGKNSSEMAVYPNPFSHQIEIYVNEESGKYTHFEMYDIVGKQVLSGSLGLKTVQYINTSQLQKGAYIIRLAGNSVSRSIKMIKAFD